MKAIDFPFNIGERGVSVTSNYARIVRAQLVDTIMTNYRERVMRPDYGSDIRALLFDPSDELRRDDTAGVLRERLAYAVPRAIIDSVDVRPALNEPGVVHVSVSYRVNEYSDPQNLTVPVSGGPTSG